MEFFYTDKTFKITNEDIIQDLLHIKNNILDKENITFKEYRLYGGKYGRKAIINHFGNWNNLLDILGIPKTRINSHLSKEEIFSIIEKIWIDLRRQPSLRDFESKSHHTKKIIISNFGKWSFCLQEFVKWENGKKNSKTINFFIPQKHKTPRDPSKSLRYDVLKRDNFKCVLCGKSPASNPKIELHIDHIIPYSEGGETILENLQTLCSECNLGKSNKNNKK